MKIGIDARFFGIAGKGLGRYTEKLIRGLEACDTENDYEIYLNQEGYDHYTPRNPRFQKVLVPYPWYGFAEQIQYPWFLYRRKRDLVHFLHFNVPLLYRKPFIVTVHDLILLHYPTQKASTKSAWWYWCKYAVYKRVIASAIFRATRVIAVSQFTHDDICATYEAVASRITTILEGVDQYCFWQSPAEETKTLETLWESVGRKASRPFALYVGNAYPHKNLEIFLLLAQEKTDTDIVLVGKQDYFYSRLQEKVKHAGITNMYFVGRVSDDMLALLYRKAKGYVFPSLYEGFGLPPLEAMQYGVPVLVSQRGSLPEIVGEAALIADPETEDIFVTTYQTLLSDEAERARLRQAGYQRAALFLWQGMAEETRRVYRAAEKTGVK